MNGLGPGRKETLRCAAVFVFLLRLLFLLKVMGRLLAALPVSCVAALCRCLGFLVIVFMPARYRLVMNSLSHAFPEKSEEWRKAVFKESAARLFEMGLFRPSSAFFDEKRLDECVTISDATLELIRLYEEGGPYYGKPVVIFLPHMTMAEGATMLPKRARGIKPVHAIFRPLNQPAVNRWVTDQREKYGAKLISRRNGYNDAMAALRRGEIVTVLFDQDASNKGSAITFMGRIASATDLPALMAHRFNADAFLMLLERKSFWKAELTLKQLPLGESPVETTIHAHDALEAYLRRDDNTAADWLWLHDRWNYFYKHYTRFRFPEKRNQIELSNRIHGYDEVPRKVRFWVRLPNWLGDVVMALPILRAIRAVRPDFEFTLIGKAGLQPLVDRLGVADQFIPLPEKGSGYFRSFYKMRKRYPDTYLLFTNSFRSDFEAYLTSCAQRYGMVRPGKLRPLLTNGFKLSKQVDETKLHQTKVWAKMLKFYGYRGELDYSPVAAKSIDKSTNRVGLICGTENSPEKRWPVAHWRELITGLLDTNSELEIVLYGTPQDREITNRVAEGFDLSRVRNLAGETDLAEFCDELSACKVVCCNDTGGMHLANMLGTSVVAVFGPTNPVRTGPIFSTPHTVLQPEGCPKTGGLSIDQVSPERCLREVLSCLSKEDS